MSAKEAQVRIKTNQLLEPVVWQCLDEKNGLANVAFDPSRIESADTLP